MAREFPEADLTPEEDDPRLPAKYLIGLSLFDPMVKTKRENLLRYRGAMVLRRVNMGDVLCRQGEEGCSAFYILKEIDLFRLRDWLRQRPMDIPKDLQALIRDIAAEEKQKKDLQDKLQTLTLKIPDEDNPQGLEDEGEPNVETEEAKIQRREAAEARLRLEIAELQKQIMRQDSEIGYLANLIKRLDEEKNNLANDLALLEATIEQIPSNRRRQWEAVYRESQKTGLGNQEGPEFALVKLAPPDYKPKPKSWWQRLMSARVSTPPPVKKDEPMFLPSESMADIDFRTRVVMVHMGEIFGEMACRNRTPRSATVRAMRSGYVLQFLSNVLDDIDNDPNLGKEKDDIYRQRVLDLHLRDLSFFRELNDDQFFEVLPEIRPNVDLLKYEANQVICDEHERPDCVYLIREGLIQVKKNVSPLLTVQDVDWPKLAALFQEATGPAAVVRGRLSQEVLDHLNRVSSPGDDAHPLRQEVVYELNDMIADRQFSEMVELKETAQKLLEDVPTRDRLGKDFPLDRRQWSDSQRRKFQRLLLETLLPGTIQPLPRWLGEEHILSYLSRGEFFGEMGVVLNIPRTASCIAYGQPRQYERQKDMGRAELVRIPKEVITDLMNRFPFLKKHIDDIIARRRRQTQAILERKVDQEGDGEDLSSEVERRGLMQGQKLMLIDLERCTRCDECVRACVDAHEDGSSRLFLLGPRVGKYLVPMTCRSCRDPVCMIGCPVRSIQRGSNQEIVIKDWCIGCELCAKQCPYDAIQMYKAEIPLGEPIHKGKRAVVCDLCSSLSTKAPACVYACPHEAALRVDALTDLPADLHKRR
ncbi:MAG: 4Fe-4S binding protein [Gemmataceae bacterium]